MSKEVGEMIRSRKCGGGGTNGGIPEGDRSWYRGRSGRAGAPSAGAAVERQTEARHGAAASAG